MALTINCYAIIEDCVFLIEPNDDERHHTIYLGVSDDIKFPDELPEHKMIQLWKMLSPGMTDEDAAEIVQGLQIGGSHEAAKEQVQALYKLFIEADCTMVEVNPLAEDDTGLLSEFGGCQLYYQWLYLIILHTHLAL